MIRAWLRFNAVSALGVAVQAAALWVYLNRIGMHYLLATALAVETAILHNFIWHWRWTWANRPLRVGAAFTCFHLGNGLISIGGNLAGMWLFNGRLHIHPQIAGLMSIAACYLFNYVFAERVAFRARQA